MDRSAAANRQIAREQASLNLKVLLRERYRFLIDHVAEGQRVLEVGAGIGVADDYLPDIELVSTDVEANDWIAAVVDAQTLPFAAQSFDAVICMLALHHMHHPLNAVREFARVLKPGGKAMILESHASRILKAALALTKHEYIDMAIDPFSATSCQTRQGDHWDGNNAVGDRLFHDRGRLLAALPEFRLLHHRFTETVLFLNSGGINYKAAFVPLPKPALEVIVKLDRLLCRVAPDIFAIHQEIVLQRV